jgi:hypothetical protein
VTRDTTTARLARYGASMDDSKWSRGWKLIVQSIAAFQQYPYFILPILSV